MNRTYAILGAGGIGCYYGARLQRCGARVCFLARSDYAHVAKHGLRIDSVAGPFNLPRIEVYDHAAALPRCDVAVVAMKTTSNHLLEEMLAPVLNECGCVLLLQNGIGEEERVFTIPGVKTVIGGLCFIAVSKVGPGHVVHQDFGSVRLAQYLPDDRPAGITEAMQRLAADLAEAGVDVELEPDLCLARWKKLVWNIPFNGLTTVLQFDTQEIMAADAHRRRAVGLMREVVAVAAAQGKSIPDEFVEKMIMDTDRMRPYLPSMRLDFDAGRPLELESMYAAPLRIAARYGVAVPLIAELYAQLQSVVSQK